MGAARMLRELPSEGNLEFPAVRREGPCWEERSGCRGGRGLRGSVWLLRNARLRAGGGLVRVS